jgi:large subunit ribosomal protein L22
MKTQTKATLSNARVAPRKARLVVNLIRGKKVDEALVALQFSKKHVAKTVKKLLASAKANALHNHALASDSLVVANAFVDEGRTMRRWRPRAFGRATPIRKRSSHITLVLEGTVDEEASKKREKEKQEQAKRAKQTISEEEAAKLEKGDEDALGRPGQDLKQSGGVQKQAAKIKQERTRKKV